MEEIIASLTREIVVTGTAINGVVAIAAVEVVVASTGANRIVAASRGDGEALHIDHAAASTEGGCCGGIAEIQDHRLAEHGQIQIKPVSAVATINAVVAAATVDRIVASSSIEQITRRLKQCGISGRPVFHQVTIAGIGGISISGIPLVAGGDVAGAFQFDVRVYSLREQIGACTKRVIRNKQDTVSQWTRTIRLTELPVVIDACRVATFNADRRPRLWTRDPLPGSWGFRIASANPGVVETWITATTKGGIDERLFLGTSDGDQITTQWAQATDC